MTRNISYCERPGRSGQILGKNSRVALKLGWYIHVVVVSYVVQGGQQRILKDSPKKFKWRRLIKLPKEPVPLKSDHPTWGIILFEIGNSLRRRLKAFRKSLHIL